MTQPHRPAFEKWPTLKVISFPTNNMPPPVVDEWCFTWCAQNARSRFQNRDPRCSTVCIRKVFPHEVRNILSYKSHANVGPDGRAKYPLPAEGQPQNLPKMLGGKRLDDSESSQKQSHNPKHWKEGWYLWTSDTMVGAFERMETMRHDIPSAQRRDVQRQKIRETWHEYQEYKERQSSPAQTDKWFGLIVPPKPLPDSSNHSLLMSLPPDFTFFERINKVLAPSRRALDIFHNTIKSGAMYSFWDRVWEKAWTKEPFILAERAFSKAYELWKAEPPDEDDRKKKSR